MLAQGFFLSMLFFSKTLHCSWLHGLNFVLYHKNTSYSKSFLRGKIFVSQEASDFVVIFWLSVAECFTALASINGHDSSICG